VTVSARQRLLAYLKARAGEALADHLTAPDTDTLKAWRRAYAALAEATSPEYAKDHAERALDALGRAAEEFGDSTSPNAGDELNRSMPALSVVVDDADRAEVIR